jgi:hypothetical protein
MTTIGPDIRRSPQTALRRAAVASPENMAARSSHGWSSPSRAPGLRRAAALIDASASKCTNPARARRLARDLRIRAAGVELERVEGDELAIAIALMRDAAHDFASL